MDFFYYFLFIRSFVRSFVRSFACLLLINELTCVKVHVFANDHHIYVLVNNYVSVCPKADLAFSYVQLRIHTHARTNMQIHMPNLFLALIMAILPASSSGEYRGGSTISVSTTLLLPHECPLPFSPSHHPTHSHGSICPIHTHAYTRAHAHST